MKSWGGGYVTDVAYMPGYYRHQAPTHLELACLLGGAAGIAPAADAPLSYVELGCGLGFGALALAASCPAWRVTAVDFHPAHIAGASALAAEAGIANVRFLELDLAEVPAEPAEIPMADVVSLHGVWSWVSPTVREGIVRLLRARVRPGGIVHVSYNALPAWQGMHGMARLLRDGGRLLAGRSDRQAAEGMSLARDLAAAGAVHLAQSPMAAALLEHFPTLPAQYVAHEYINDFWAPCFHADVTETLADAKLEWVASANPAENFPALTLTEAQRAVRDRFDDVRLRELIKDLCLPRGLRSDVFVRGARRLGNAARDAALGRVHLALLRHPDHFAYEAGVPAGTVELTQPAYGPIVAALAATPRPVEALLALPALEGRGNPAEVAAMLTQSEQVMPVCGPPTLPGDAARRFNRVVAGLVDGTNLDRSAALATSGLGAPLPCQMLDLWVLARLAETGAAPDAAAWADRLAAGRDEAERRRLEDHLLKIVRERVSVWRALAIA